MCKPPNEGKKTTIFPQCLTQSGSRAYLSSLYLPSDLWVEHTECCDDHQFYHLFAPIVEALAVVFTANICVPLPIFPYLAFLLS